MGAADRCNFLRCIPCQCAEDEEKKKVRAAKAKKLEGQKETLWGMILLLLTLKEPMLHSLWQTDLLTRAQQSVSPLDEHLLTRRKQKFLPTVPAPHHLRGGTPQPERGTQDVVWLFSTTTEKKFSLQVTRLVIDKAGREPQVHLVHLSAPRWNKFNLWHSWWCLTCSDEESMSLETLYTPVLSFLYQQLFIYLFIYSQKAVLVKEVALTSINQNVLIKL